MPRSWRVQNVQRRKSQFRPKAGGLHREQGHVWDPEGTEAPAGRAVTKTPHGTARVTWCAQTMVPSSITRCS